MKEMIDADLPDVFEDITIGVDMPLRFPFTELRVTAFDTTCYDLWDIIEDMSDSRSCYMFSKLRFQKKGPPPKWSPFKDLDAALTWLELTPIDTQYPAFSTGDLKPEEEIHVIEGYPLVLVNSGEVLMYGLRVLKFGDFDDLKKFFSFFRAEPCFKMPPTAVQVKRNLQTTVPPDEQAFTEKGLV